jgi:nitrate reductase NapE component
MNSTKNLFSHHLGTLILVLFGILTLGFVVEARDAFGFMGWVFCFAVVLTAGQSAAPQQMEEYR